VTKWVVFNIAIHRLGGMFVKMVDIPVVIARVVPS
jgi:hypothetical protein